MSIKVKPLTGSIGASIEGINLNRPVDDATFEELHRAFLEHCVLVYRGQRLEPEAQVAFAKLWFSSDTINTRLNAGTLGCGLA